MIYLSKLRSKEHEEEPKQYLWKTLSNILSENKKIKSNIFPCLDETDIKNWAIIPEKLFTKLITLLSSNRNLLTISNASTGKSSFMLISLAYLSETIEFETTSRISQRNLRITEEMKKRKKIFLKNNKRLNIYYFSFKNSSFYRPFEKWEDIWKSMVDIADKKNGSIIFVFDDVHIINTPFDFIENTINVSNAINQAVTYLWFLSRPISQATVPNRLNYIIQKENQINLDYEDIIGQMVKSRLEFKLNKKNDIKLRLIIKEIPNFRKIVPNDLLLTRIALDVWIARIISEVAVSPPDRSEVRNKFSEVFQDRLIEAVRSVSPSNSIKAGMKIEERFEEVGVILGEIAVMQTILDGIYGSNFISRVNQSIRNEASTLGLIKLDDLNTGSLHGYQFPHSSVARWFWEILVTSKSPFFKKIWLKLENLYCDPKKIQINTKGLFTDFLSKNQSGNLVISSLQRINSDQLNSLIKLFHSETTLIKSIFRKGEKIQGIHFNIEGKLDSLILEDVEKINDEIGTLTSIKQLLIVGKTKTISPKIRNLNSLTYLMILKCDLGFIHEDLFTIKNLETISITSSNLKELPAISKKNKKELHLKFLTLALNKLNKIPKNFFLNMRNLSYLNMGGNDFSELPQILSGLNSLIELNFYHNKIKRLPEPLIGFPSLMLLDLSSNKIKKIPIKIEGMQNIVEINFQDNLIKEIPASICNFKNLRKLNLNLNCINDLPDFINDLNNLEILFISSNHLRNISKSICKLRNLKKIDFSHNFLEKFPETSKNIENLRVLDLSFNNFANFPPSLFKLHSLRELYLSGNLITELPIEISYLKNLQVLMLDGNELTDLPDSMKKLAKLSILSLFNNKFINIPDSIRKIPNLKVLIIAFNDMKLIEKFKGFPKGLETLFLTKKQFSNLYPKLKKLKRLKHVFLDNYESTDKFKGDIANLKRRGVEIYYLCKEKDDEFSCMLEYKFKIFDYLNSMGLEINLHPIVQTSSMPKLVKECEEF